MIKILFLHGGGDDGYEADLKMATSLKEALGSNFDISYPRIKSNESIPDFGWPQEIHNHIAQCGNKVFIVAHSLGASMLLKCLSELSPLTTIKGLFLLATPFWSGPEEWKQGLILNDNFTGLLPKNLPIFFYHCKDDNEVPISHLSIYRQKIAKASFRELQNGGHQFDADFTPIINDIKTTADENQSINNAEN